MNADVTNIGLYAMTTRCITDESSNCISKLFQPVTIKEEDSGNIGVELTGKINKPELLKALNQFSQKKEVYNLCKQYGLDGMYYWI